ncbi:dihydrodipicolinate synthase family protein [Microvirga brassicacearum]|uniref:Dihydrodipicolinate synthase family protein n=2 Tax=Microvirga brassicacearum TaxID=2580413 RepID=A0A5N3PET0_9HYPH|nr:dihydrodipicolinate synthase family protein [Microvirga brassicacearum]
MTTPFREDGAIDLPRLVDHARWCLQQGCASVTAFGTTGEGASVGTSGREQVLGALAGGGIAPRNVVYCVAATSLHEALAQGRMAYDFGARALLLPPPFYFKGVSDEGLFAWFSQLLGKLGKAARDVILYNIPSVTQVALSVELIGRIKNSFPGVITGVKDSSGDWDYTQRLLAAHKDLAILIGDERYLAEGVALGGQGAISGLANVCPQVLLSLVQNARPDARINALVDEVLRYPVTPAVKALVAHRTGDAEWRHVRAPLVALPTGTAASLSAAYDTLFALKAA